MNPLPLFSFAPFSSWFPDVFQRALLLLSTVCFVNAISGCAVVPGQDTYSMRTQSSLKLPVQVGDELVPAHVTVKPINAELIIGMQKAAYKETPSRVPPVGFLDYHLGPGDIINIIVWEHPELTIPAGEFRSAEASGTLISERGTIFYPFIGVLKVAGLTLSQLRA